MAEYVLTRSIFMVKNIWMIWKANNCFYLKVLIEYDMIVVKMNHLRQVSRRQHAQQAPAKQAQQSSAPKPLLLLYP